MPGVMGVVGRKAFDAVVVGVGEVRSKLHVKGDSSTLEMVDTALLKATDQEHRDLVEQRRGVLRV